MSKLLGDFWAGLTDRTTTSWVGAVGVCLAELAACAALLRPQTLARIDPSYLMADRQDEYALLTSRLAVLRYRPDRRIQVAYVGTSCATRALTTRSASVLSKEVSAAAGASVSFLPLSTNGQRMEESLIIVDRLPRAFRGVVVFVVTDYLDDYANAKKLRLAHTRIAVPSAPSILPIWKAEGYTPPHTGNFFFDHLDFFAARRAIALRLGHARGRLGQGAFHAEKLEAEIDRFDRDLELVEQYGENAAKAKDRASAPLLTKSRDVAEGLLSHASERGAVVVFVRAPDLPTRTAAYGERSERFDRELAELAGGYGALVWDFNPDLDLDDADFQDAVHLGSERGRRRFEDRLVSELGELIRDRFEVGATRGAAPARRKPAAQTRALP